MPAPSYFWIVKSPALLCERFREVPNVNARPLAAFAMAFAVWCFSFDVNAQQYRSKLFLDPALSLSDSEQLSLEELEKQFATISDSYDKSSAGRQLARHFVKGENYSKAIDYYQSSLASEGLSQHAVEEMRVELATVYLLQKNYSAAVTTLGAVSSLNDAIAGKGRISGKKNSGGEGERSGETKPAWIILFARAYSGVGDHLSVVNALEPLRQLHASLTELQLKQMLALYYQASSYPHCEALLLRLIDDRPQHTAYWRQLTSVYLAQKKYKAAMDRLELSRLKRITQRPSDIKLLAELYVTNGAAEKGARLLSVALEKLLIADNEENNIRLFEYWLQAREKSRATDALQRRIALVTDVGLHLQLAQLQMEAEQWASMEATITNVCTQTLDDRYVSRANLLLGVSRLKQGDSQGARQSFINATLVAGETSKALQWLAFMEAEQPTDKELRRISKPCAPKDTRVRHVATTGGSTPLIDQGDEGGIGNKAAHATGLSQSGSGEADLKRVEYKAQRLFTIGLSLDEEQMGKRLGAAFLALNVALVKSGGSSNGPVQVLLVNQPAGTLKKDMQSGPQLAGLQKPKLQLRLAQPYKGLANIRGRYKLEKSAPYSALSGNFVGNLADIQQQLVIWQQQALGAGYELSGDNRLVFKSPIKGTKNEAGSNKFSAELMLGIL